MGAQWPAGFVSTHGDRPAQHPASESNRNAIKLPPRCQNKLGPNGLLPLRRAARPRACNRAVLGAAFNQTAFPRLAATGRGGPVAHI
jgi:hypothetical protein